MLLTGTEKIIGAIALRFLLWGGLVVAVPFGAGVLVGWWFL